jgi:hypothetical protein
MLYLARSIDLITTYNVYFESCSDMVNTELKNKKNGTEIAPPIVGL